MKKIVLSLLLGVGLIPAFAQEFEMGVKLGVHTGRTSLDAIQNYSLNSDSEAKLHGGIYANLKLKGLGWFIQPEALITTRAADLKVSGSNLSSTNPSLTDVTVHHSALYADVPVLVGMKFIKLIRVYGGPNFQFLLNQDTHIPSTADQIKAMDLKKNTTGVILGAGLDFWKIRADVRWNYAPSLGANIQFNNGQPELKSSMISIQVAYQLFGIL